jgi:hypothetical protein
MWNLQKGEGIVMPHKSVGDTAPVHMEDVFTDKESEQVVRDKGIYQDWNRSHSIEELCAKWGVSPRTIQRAVNRVKSGMYGEPPKKLTKKDIHDRLTGGIYKKRAPLPPLSVSY